MDAALRKIESLRAQLNEEQDGMHCIHVLSVYFASLSFHLSLSLLFDLSSFSSFSCLNILVPLLRRAHTCTAHVQAKRDVTSSSKLAHMLQRDVDRLEHSNAALRADLAAVAKATEQLDLETKIQPLLREQQQQIEQRLKQVLCFVLWK